MNKFPEIKTSRLILGKLSYQDIPTIVAYAGNQKIAATTANIPHPYQEKDALFWLNMAYQGFEQKRQYTFGIRLADSNEFIGGIGLNINDRFHRAELGYWIAVPFWNNGYTTEAVAALLKFGFQKLKLNKIYATHLVENPASGKVMIKNHMIKEAVLKDHIIKNGQYKSLIQYRLTKSEFEDLNQAI